MKRILARLQKEYINKGLLRFPKNAKIDRKLPLDQFLLLLINSWNVYYNTYEAESRKMTDEMNLHRSIEDIYRITRYYKPEVTLMEVCQMLFELRSRKQIFCLWCSTIKKITFFPIENRRFYSDHLYDRHFGSKGEYSINGIRGGRVETYKKFFNSPTSYD